MQDICMFIDDSGVLHPNDAFFIYGGYVFTDKETREDAKREYRSLLSNIDKELLLEAEYKAASLENKHKRALYNVMRRYHSFGISVKTDRVYPNIMDDKRSRNRFKDYALKRGIKFKIEKMIKEGQIDPSLPVKFTINIDQQSTATNGLYGLSESIREEFTKGISNFDYNTFHKPLFYNKFEISTHYCDSKSNYLIQASDILANRLYTSYQVSRPELRKIPNHHCLHLP